MRSQIQETSIPELTDPVYRKVTLRLMPFLFLCYVLSFLDRINIGFAQLQMKKDLGLSDAAYGFGASIFFVGYLIFGVPSNVLQHRLGARKTISILMMGWGLASAAMMFVSTSTEFASGRFLLGGFEAGLLPGVILYLTYWYPARRRSEVTALFFSATAVAGLIAGPLSGGIMTRMHELHGLRGWQWMFVLEGLPSTVIGIFAWFYLTDKPVNAKWLDTKEKEMIQRCLDDDHAVSEGNSQKNWAHAFRNPMVYLLSLINFSAMAGGYAISYWMPTMIQEFGIHDPFQIGLYSMIPYGSGIVVMLYWSRHSDRTIERRWHYAVTALVAALGFALVTVSKGNFPLAMLALSVTFAGVVSSFPIFWAVPPMLLSKAAAPVGIAVIVALSTLGGVVAPWLIGILKTVTGNINFGLYPIITLLILSGVLMLIGISAQKLSGRAER